MNRLGSALFFVVYFVGAILFAQDSKKAAATPVATTLNQELPNWLRFSFDERVRMENINGVGMKDVGDLYLMNRLRLGVDVRPLPWLRFQLEAQDSRVFGQNTLPAPASQKDAMDLRIGYVLIGSEEGPVVLRAGRQALSFGEGRLLADPNWSNVGRSFDGGRVTLRRGAKKVDLFSGIAVKGDPTGFNYSTPGEHFHGVYGSLGKMIPNATIEPYLFWRLEHGYKNERGQLGHLDEKSIGFRWVGTLPYGFDYGAEMAKQLGSYAGDPVKAWAGHWVVGHTLPDTRHRPRLFAELNRASGDANAKDGVRGGFDPLFPSTHDKLGITDVFTWINLVHLRSGFEYTLNPRIKLAAAYNSFWLADAHDGAYVGGKLLARSATGGDGRHIGQQADVQGTYTMARGTQLNIGYGHLFPGGFLQRVTAGNAYQIVFCNVVQRF